MGTYLGGAKLHKHFLEKFVIIKKGEIVNINISLILILMITNLIKIVLKAQIILSYRFHTIKVLYSIKSNFMIFLLMI